MQGNPRAWAGSPQRPATGAREPGPSPPLQKCHRVQLSLGVTTPWSQSGEFLGRDSAADRQQATLLRTGDKCVHPEGRLPSVAVSRSRRVVQVGQRCHYSLYFGDAGQQAGSEPVAPTHGSTGNRAIWF